MQILTQIDKVLLNILKTITITAFVLLTVILAANILFRYVPIFSLLWSDEIIELLFAYLVFYGSAALWISREHFSAGDWIGGRLIKNERGRHCYRLLIEVMGLAFVAVFLYFSYQLTVSNASVTNVLALPKKIFYSCMPIAGVIMFAYSIRNIVAEFAGMVKPRQAAGVDKSAARVG